MNQKAWIYLVLFIFTSGAIWAGLVTHKTIAIIIDDQVETAVIWGFTVSDALSQAGVPIAEGDLISPPINEKIQENEIITINRAGWVFIKDNQKIHKLWTAERTPSRLLSMAELHLKPDDLVISNGIPINLDKELSYKPVHILQILPATKIIIKADGESHAFTTREDTLGEALQAEGFRWLSGDELEPSANTYLNGGEIQVSLRRSKEVIIDYRGLKIKTRILAQTVGEALAAAKLPLQGLDYSIPGEDQPVPEDGKIKIIQVREELIVEQEPIPFGLEYRPLDELELDSQQIVQTGEIGILARRIRVLYENGEEIDRKNEGEWIAKTPQPRIIGYGTRINLRSVNTPEGSVQYYRAVEAYATSYSPCRIGIPDKCSNRTASGAELKKGVIGVIRSWYNALQGSRVYIPGYGFATIEDIGAGFSDRRWIDLGYSDEDWINWSQYVTVYFLAPPPATIPYFLD